MRGRLLARRALLGVLALVLAACAREDGSRILGTWRAERMELMSFKLPVGPELRIERDALRTGGDIRLPIAAITQKGDEVTLDTESMIGLTFYFVEADRMYLDLPLVGHIYYRRVGEPAAGQGSVAVIPPAVAVVPQAAPVRPVPVTPVRDAVAPAWAQDYSQALALVREGDRDGAVRSLNRAFGNGFHDTGMLGRTPEFAVLKDDVRYQALLARYANP
ncbi:hypothetical protein [uncultured Massilia sp.]|uniref:hypothetical protein n=1 Tax=uncultured Massilia sp. TaxID=169973 RepID=UPI0025846343|nr:hypothetical protein [uncultured Massilia sp.]